MHKFVTMISKRRPNDYMTFASANGVSKENGRTKKKREREKDKQQELTKQNVIAFTLYQICLEGSWEYKYNVESTFEIDML